MSWADIWPQPLDPLHSLSLSALVAAVPLTTVLLLMGVFRKGGLLASCCGLASTAILALAVWGMPFSLATLSVAYGFLFALWSILWIVFNALWLYHLSIMTGSFDLLRRWMQEHASGEAGVQAILVAFCFGALLEGSAGFGAPVAVTAFLLVGLGFEAMEAVVVSLIANTAPVAFGALGVPIVALAGVTGLDLMKLSAMVGRQLPLLSVILPLYLVMVVSGYQGLRRSWPAALVGGLTFAAAQFLISNIWGPFATDIIAALVSVAALTAYLRISHPAVKVRPNAVTRAVVSGQPPQEPLPGRLHVAAWLPWAWLSAVMILWSYFKFFQRGQVPIAIGSLHNGVLITLYHKPYAAIYSFQPLTGGTAVLVATLLSALCFRAKGPLLVESGIKAARQLRIPGITVLMIVGLAYLFNYSGMAYTMGASVARAGRVFPILSSYLGWIACFLSGSDTSSNLLFGNLQVAAAHNLHLNQVLLAATNSSGAVTGKMISPQNIAVGVTTVGLIGKEGSVLRRTFWHSVLLAGLLGMLSFAQAYWLAGMVP
ncbi:MAG: L-lactate permease [Acidobacteria bacterium]|nr:L-lactate permease [Acidobacteriota bacterium]